ncbi:DUF6320 domain-containing protein [Christensenellaceae bacterium OttesenSCG-928-K19]|nr:DUF6320 domain-containing protein [Christensenellaceae bacterium OttesenSCG-928-K19]
MNYCEECNVYVDDSLHHCPLCGKVLTSSPQPNGLYPDVVEKDYIDRRTFMTDLFLFLTFLFIGGSVILNLLVFNGTPWFLLVAAPILYVWILVRITIISDMHVGAKVLFQILGVMGLALAYDFVFGWHGWSYEYVLPFLLIAAIAYIDVYSYIHKSQWRDNLVYAVVFVLLGFLPFIFYFTGVTHAAIPMALCTFASGLTILGLLRFAVRRAYGEIKKRFHI